MVDLQLGRRSPVVGSKRSRRPALCELDRKDAACAMGDPGNAGFLGAAYSPFKPDGPGMENMKLHDIAIDRLNDRKGLLTSIDTLRRDIDRTGTMVGMDAFSQRALDVLTSSKLLDALDLSKEDPRIRESYGDGKPFKFQYDGAPTCNEHFFDGATFGRSRSASRQLGLWSMDSTVKILNWSETMAQTRSVLERSDSRLGTARDAG